MKEICIKKIMMASASLLLLSLTACVVLSFFRSPWFENIQAEIVNEPYTKTVTVSAEGKVNAKPDIAVINLSVVTEGKTVGEVTEEGNTKMTAVINAVKELNVDSKDIASTQYSLYPRYHYPENRQRELSGYSLSQNIQIKVRDLAKVEDVLDEGVSAGANQVGQLSFDIDDPSEIKREAREMAFKTAKEKAEEMAKAAGVKLGSVVTFSEGSSYQPPVYANFAMDSMEKAVGGASASIEAGSTDINVSVSVTYEIE